MTVEEMPFVKPRATASFALLLLTLSIAAFLPWYTEGFIPGARRKAPIVVVVVQRWTTQKVLRAESIDNNDDNDDDDDDDLFVTRKEGVTIDQSLSRPLFNNPRDPKSLLFSETSSSTRNEQQQEQQQRKQDQQPQDDDMALSVWQTCKTQLPFVLTGASRTPTTAADDDNPIGGVYNIIFVRLPTILAGLVYVKNLILLDGGHHGMVVDLGVGGPFEVPPLVVCGALYVILR